jgi:hypothetical protein
MDRPAIEPSTPGWDVGNDTTTPLPCAEFLSYSIYCGISIHWYSQRPTTGPCPTSDACSHFISRFLGRMLTPSSPSVPPPSSTERNNVCSYSCSAPTYFHGVSTGKPLRLPLPLPLHPISNRLDSTNCYQSCCTFGASGIKSRPSQPRVKPYEMGLSQISG